MYKSTSKQFMEMELKDKAILVKNLQSTSKKALSKVRKMSIVEKKTIHEFQKMFAPK